MHLTWFKDLGNLAVTGNFSQAARMSHVSQPAFSRRIKALEEWVGTALVDRGRHPVVLTSAGNQMLEASIQAFERLEYERAQILEAQALPDKYVVTFGAQHSIGWRFYPAWLQAFEEAYGPIISKLRADDLQFCLEALQNGEIDFVIGYESKYARGHGGTTTFEALTIGSDALIPVCKPNINRLPMFQLDQSDAPPVPWLRFGDSAPISRHIDPLLDETNIRSRLSVVYENSMAGALRIRAREGAGVAWLPKSLVAPDIEAGVLVEAGPASLSIALEICLLRKKEHTNRLTRDIWAYLATRQGIPLIVPGA